MMILHDYQVIIHIQMDLQISQQIKLKTLNPPHLVSVRKMIQQPNELIDRNELNKIYPENWINIEHHYQPSLKSTLNQCRNVCRLTNKNIKYDCSLSQANFGTILYDRFPQKNSNLWEIGITHYPKYAEEIPIKQGQLIFDSKFESGNLSKAFVKEDKRKGKVYTLVLENDTNTFGYNQWFYFRIKSQRNYETAKFEIVNMRKSFSLFQKGMKIAVFSDSMFKKQKTGWHRGGNNIQYDFNGLLDDKGNKLSTLSFQFTFENTEYVYFAYSYPFTYSQLKKNLKELQLAHKSANIKTIGLSVLRNDILLLEENQKPVKKKKAKESKEQKDVLIVMARVHPGETVSSFVMKGFINAFFSDLPQAQYLKSKLSVKMIPMQNPDGVIHGNTRTSMTGNDLNRRWLLPSQILHPQIYCIKKYIQSLENAGHKIFGMIDLHAHTKKESSFFYGCCAKKNYRNHYRVRLLNYVLANYDKNFKPEFSSFYVSSSKRSTARVTFFNEFCDFSYTLESTFMSAHENMLHYSIKDYEGIGRNLLKSLAYLKESVNPTDSVLLDNHLKKKITEVAKKPQKYFPKEEKQGSDSGSSSSPSFYNYSQEFLQSQIIRKKTSTPSGRYRKIKIERTSISPRKFDLSQRKQKKSSFSHIKSSRPELSKQIMGKLPLLSFDSKQVEKSSYQFYNFKSKRLANQKKKIFFEKTTIN